MERSAMIATVNKYVEAFEKQDMDIIRAIYADDATVEDPVGSGVRVGIESICEFYENGLNAGAKLALTGAPRCAGNAVAFPFQVRMPGLVIDVIDVFEFNDSGKVKGMKAYWSDGNMRADG